MKSGCEYIKCTDFKNGVCYYHETSCKYRAEEDELAALKEDAEKWHMHIKRILELQEAENNIKIIMRELVVEERCGICRGAGKVSGNAIPYDNGTYVTTTCIDCHGTGIITRLATAAEIREVLDNPWQSEPIYSEAEGMIDDMPIILGWTFKLPTGRVLNMRDRKNNSTEERK